MDRRRGGNSPKYMKVGELAERCVDGTEECEGHGDTVEDSSSERLKVRGEETSHDDGGDEDSGISELTGEDAALCERVSPSSASLEVRRKNPPHIDHIETLPMMIVQIVIPFFFAGFGMMAAGLLLDTVQVSFQKFLTVYVVLEKEKPCDVKLYVYLRELVDL